MDYKYGSRFAAFIDILGFKQMIAKVENRGPGYDQIFSKLNSVLNFLNEESIESNGQHDLTVYEVRDDVIIERELGEPRITYVSDCAIVSAEGTHDGFKSLCNKLTKLATDLASDGFFLRGAITYGPLFHNEKLVFGSAYQCAYELESTKAKTPRIIIDNSVTDFLVDSVNDFPLNDFGTRVDVDGQRYLHCFPWQYYPQYTSDWIGFLLRVKGHIIYSLNLFDMRFSGLPRELIELDRFYCWKESYGWELDFTGSNKNILEKYLWLKDEFNRTLHQHADFLKNDDGQARLAKIVDLGSHWGPEIILGGIR